jgi:Transcriptional Coactivator p15 (PC4)
MTDAPFVPPGPAANWRQVADTVSTFTEPVTVAEWWKNRRGESIRLVLSQFQGRSIIDLRNWYTADGKLKPGKGFAADIKHLPRLQRRSPKPKAGRASCT